MLKVRLHFTQNTLKGGWCEVSVHLLKFLATIQDPIEAFDTSRIVFLLRSIDPRHGSSKGLSFIDQVIKALLYFAPSEISIPVIPNILSILVILNKYQTLVLQAADKFASPYIVACAKLLLLPFFLLLLYLLSKSKNRFNFKTPIGYAGVTLISSAILSTVLDSLIYKGTPDYFYLIPLYSSVDLKDVFAFLGAGCILSIISTNEKNTQKKTTNMGAK